MDSRVNRKRERAITRMGSVQPGWGLNRPVETVLAGCKNSAISSIRPDLRILPVGTIKNIYRSLLLVNSEVTQEEAALQI